MRVDLLVATAVIAFKKGSSRYRTNYRKKDPWLYRTFSRYGLFGPPSLSLVYDQFDHPRPLHTVTISSLQWVGDERSEYTFSIM